MEVIEEVIVNGLDYLLRLLKLVKRRRSCADSVTRPTRARTLSFKLLEGNSGGYNMTAPGGPSV